MKKLTLLIITLLSVNTYCQDQIPDLNYDSIVNSVLECDYEVEIAIITDIEEGIVITHGKDKINVFRSVKFMFWSFYYNEINLIQPDTKFPYLLEPLTYERLRNIFYTEWNKK